MTAERRGDVVVAAAVLLPVALFLLREHRIAGDAGFPLDDSWIHLQFARNLADGAGFSYNPGAPVAGSTAPLWTLLLALGVLVAGASVVTVKAFGIACVAAASLVTRRAARAWGAPAPVATAAGLTLAWLPPMVWGALSGMEVGLAALLVAAALLASAREAPGLTALFGALAALARPESILLVPLLAVARRPTARHLGVFTAVAAVVLLPAIAFSWATVGGPLPATAVAKVDGGLVGFFRGVHEPAARLLFERPWAFLVDWAQWLTATHALLVPAAAAGATLAWRCATRPLGVAALALVLHPLGMALLAPYRGPAFQEGRYSIHLLPLAMTVVAVAVWPRATRARQLATAAALLLAIVALVPAAERYGWGVQNINAMQVHLGRWLDGHTPRAATLAVNDIGAIGFFSRREIVDLMGLVTPEVVPYRRDGEAGVRRFVTVRCPDYVVIFPSWFPALAADRTLLAPIYRVRLDHVEVSGGPEMVVYRVARCAV